MPFTRPRAISNGVSLSDKLTTAIALGRFVSEHGAVDALLPAVIDELAPDEHGVTVSGPENDVLAGANELAPLSSVSILVGAVVSLIEFKATFVAVLCDVPVRHPGRVNRQ